MGTDTLYRTGRSQILAVLAVVAALASVLFAINAQAAPPTPEAELWMVGDDGARVAAEPDDAVRFGDTVSFDFEIIGKTAKKYTLSMSVRCWQGSMNVYSWAGQPGTQFPLMSQSTTGNGWDGGAANCRAALQYRAHNRATTIGTYEFHVAAAL